MVLFQTNERTADASGNNSNFHFQATSQQNKLLDDVMPHGRWRRSWSKATRSRDLAARPAALPFMTQTRERARTSQAVATQQSTTWAAATKCWATIGGNYRVITGGATTGDNRKGRNTRHYLTLTRTCSNVRQEL